MDKLQAMATFVSIVDRGSLTRAAESLSVSLPSVVRTLGALERDVGVRLLNRTTRRLHLTDEGALYLAQCRAILSAVRDADALLEARRVEPRGRVAVTAPVLFGRRYVVPIVTRFLSEHPAVTAEALLLDRVVSLVEEGLDVGVRIGTLADSSLIAVAVGELRRVVVASPSWLKRHGVPKSPEDLRRVPCVRFGGLTPAAEWRFKASRPLAIPVAARFASNQVDAAIIACESGLGPGMFLSYQVADAVAAGRLRHVLAAFEREPVPVSVIYPQAKLRSGTVRAFVDLAVAALREARFA
ncbi:MAG TPA: LysR family transcriptional regulator [Casimicrobiaceae bacterium]|nr:LysR family transcriptional regulator [Casimicrobiaceae bacterium]